MNRLKKARKTLDFYRFNFGITAPYRVMLDVDFVQTALEQQVLLREQIPKLLQSETKILVTRCILAELREKGKHYSGAYKIASSFPCYTCVHENGNAMLPAKECILSLVANGNPQKLCITTQTFKFRDAIRSIPGIPMFYLQGQVPIFDDPSEASLKIAAEKEAAKSKLSETEKKIFGSAKEKKVKPDVVFQKRKAPHAPNPLSCKKSKKNKPNPVSKETSTQLSKTNISVDKAPESIITPSTSNIPKLPKKKRNRRKEKQVN